MDLPPGESRVRAMAMGYYHAIVLMGEPMFLPSTRTAPVGVGITRAAMIGGDGAQGAFLLCGSLIG